MARHGLTPSRWRPTVQGRGVRPRLSGSGPLVAGGPGPLGAATGAAGAAAGREGSGAPGGILADISAATAAPGPTPPSQGAACSAGGRGRACLPWGQRRAPRAPAGRPAARPCARGTLCRPAAVPVPCPQALRRARGHAHRPGDPGAGRAVPSPLAHDPPDQGRARLGRSPHARVPLKAPPDRHCRPCSRGGAGGGRGHRPPARRCFHCGIAYAPPPPPPAPLMAPSVHPLRPLIGRGGRRALGGIRDMLDDGGAGRRAGVRGQVKPEPQLRRVAALQPAGHRRDLHGGERQAARVPDSLPGGRAQDTRRAARLRPSPARRC